MEREAGIVLVATDLSSSTGLLPETADRFGGRDRLITVCHV